MSGRDDTPDRAPAYSVVIPTTGRDGLITLLRGLAHGEGPQPREVLVIDDRPPSPAGKPLALPDLGLPLRVLDSGGRGPAAARNVGWRAADSEWIAFLDDDVLTAREWPARLAGDLTGLGDDVAASVARIDVPLPDTRRPTDDERDTLALTRSRWITADMAYRREALVEVGGFDERFPRAYREDADLALRVRRAGWRISEGDRVTTHPPKSGGFFASVRRQRGNADNALMRAKHGGHWRHEAGEGPGRLGRHALASAAGIGALALAATRAPRAAALAAGVWTGLTAEFAVSRIAPGPRTPREVTRMAVTSAVIPPVACAHRLAGEWRVRHGRAVLFDRDDTLIEDVPYLADPEKVRPMAGAADALALLRAEGVPVGVVSNQSGVARGHITAEQLRAVTRRVDELLGPFQTWQHCPHGPDDGCPCRKPRPAMVLRAAADLGVDVRRCVVVGDIGADVEAALTAGARAILVPTGRTLPDEIELARRHAIVAPDLPTAARIALELA
ncbi:HAD-IIIA family hydrolase [Saccharomonospora xinjiangensis]|uniref:HAD-IIIA family hydrolase n=1 Tax=Saccharomonospora xinjiangensis TaxID=75294 RepID=UPI00106F837E|nr:HAD-IIIA family hydrolase [Saccharomonospora xinjiangensis]QBQ59600.1 D-glycero-beta-D-manno-heptose-1,7-bisphosphate 7-phosphatase [Saccharomonospora xinjiangensis]